MLIANLPLYLIKEEPLQRQQGADRVFADSLCFFPLFITIGLFWGAVFALSGK